MDTNSNYQMRDVWKNHSPSPVETVSTSFQGIHTQFQEMQYDERGAWDTSDSALHIASLVTTAQHRYGGAANRYNSIAPSSSVVMPDERLVGAWEGKMVGRHLFISQEQFTSITGKEIGDHNIQPFDFTLQSEKNSDQDIIVRLLGVLAHDARNQSPTGSIFAETIISAILQNLTGEDAKIWHYDRVSSTNSDKISQKIMDILQANLTTGIALMDIANELDISVQYLCRAFKKTTGLSPHQYLLRERVYLARTLIMETRIPLAEIALEVGFSDQSQLSTTFKNFLGYSPSQLRN